MSKMIQDNDILNARILIVDDNQSNVDLLESMLAADGYTSVLSTTDSRETIGLYKSHQPELILLDINMPHLNGYQVMERLSEIEQDDLVPILVLTALQDRETCIRSLKSGAKDFLAKPFDQTETLTRIHNMLESRLLHNRIKEYKDNLDAIFKSIKDAIITVDKNLVILQYNKTAEEICGFPGNNEAKGKKYESFTNNCSATCLEALTETLKTKLPAENNRFECNRCGTRRVVSAITYPLFDNKNKFDGCVLILKDETRLANLESDINERHQLQNIIGKSDKMQKVYSFIEMLSNTQTTVLITGGNGTGKDLVAEALHYHKEDSKKPFVVVNCTALSDNLLESELFGHVKGAFTGAVSDRVERFQKADGGTIFLDEIGDISNTMQLRLLRVLQNMEFERVGDSTPIKVNVRVIAATNQDLRKKVKLGNFREDLYYRLKVAVLGIPPLRDRREDIPLLVDYFKEKLNKTLNKNIKGLSADVQKIFMNYKWPGNIRELQHTLEYAFVLCNDSIITTDNIPSDFEGIIIDELQLKRKSDRDEIVQALEKSGWNKAKAARLLGIHQTTIYEMIKKT